MTAGEVKRVRAGGASLLADFKQLGALPSAHERGYQLEVLLEQLFRRAHFRIDRNASVAKPRQTDLVARYGNTWYLIEAKWHNEPANINVFDSVRSRMERAASSAVIGVIISVNGFTDSAVKDLRATRFLGLAASTHIESSLGVLPDATRTISDDAWKSGASPAMILRAAARHAAAARRARIS
jgi:hypothetical protein